MKTFESNIFGQLPEPETFQELLGLVVHEEGDAGRARMWRGQSDISWRLDSSAYRRLLNSNRITLSTPCDKVEQEIVSYETYLLKRAYYYGFQTSEGRKLSDIELLARLRHYGAATRLLDCSKNALVALWFAACAKSDQYGALFGIHCQFLSGHESYIEEGCYAEIVEGLSLYDFPRTWAPNGLTPRTAAQHSVFIYSDACTSSMGSVRISDRYGSFLPIAISPALKEITADILKESFNIYHFSLFPDLEGFSCGNNELADRWSMERW